MKKVSTWDRFCNWFENKVRRPNLEENPWHMTKERREEVSRIGMAPIYIAGGSRMKFNRRG